MTEPDPVREERLETYKKVWRFFIYMGWPAALAVLWLGSRIIDGLHARIVALERTDKTSPIEGRATP